jgi:hypothetical protein
MTTKTKFVAILILAAAVLINLGGNWVIRRSTDNGANWTTTLSTAGSGAAITRDTVTGNLYAVGKIGANVVVQKSTEGGLNWSSTGTYAGSQGNVSSAAIAARNDVVVYTGYDRSNSSTFHVSCMWYSFGRWFARVSSNGGSSWAMPDDFIRSTPCNSKGVGVAIDSNGLIFAGGNYQSNTGQIYNLVRKSSDNGVSWTTVDTYSYVSGKHTTPVDIAIDSADRVFVLAKAIDSGNESRWLVRMYARTQLPAPIGSVRLALSEQYSLTCQFGRPGF